MTDERLRAALHAELDVIPLPERFQTPSALAARAGRRASFPRPLPRRTQRRAWFGAVAAVVCLVTLFGFSPIGVRAAKVVSEKIVSSFNFSQAPLTPEPGALDRLEALKNLKPGDTITFPAVKTADSFSPAQTVRAMTLADLVQEQPAWPLPTYLPPAPDTVVQVSTYEGDDDTTAMFSYPVTLESGQQGSVFFTYVRRAEPWDEATVRHAATKGSHTFAPHITVRTQQVTLRSEQVTAYSIDDGQSWDINWISAWGHGAMSASLPLEELVRIIESIPTL